MQRLALGEPSSSLYVLPGQGVQEVEAQDIMVRTLVTEG